MLMKQAFSLSKHRYDEYDLLINNSDEYTISFNHKNSIIHIKNNGITIDSKHITRMYDKDYFDKATLQTIEYALIFLDSISTGRFEYDTYFTDNLLSAFKQAINEIDI